MISNLPIEALTSPVGIAIIKRLFPQIKGEDLDLIKELVTNYGKSDATVGDVLNDPIVASIIDGKSEGKARVGTAISDYSDALVKCPSCSYVGEMSQFAPKLFKGVTNGKGR